MSKYWFKRLISVLVSTAFIPVSAANIAEISVSECKAMATAGVMSAAAPVQCDRLRQVLFDYIDFQGQQHNNGSIIVMDAVAPYIATIFERLYILKFPINKAQPIRHYQGDDDLSMADNNTSAFNYRPIAGKRSLSIHAYGLAVDINPKQNPFVEFGEQGSANFKPENGAKYANRMQFRYGKDQRQGFAEDVISTFADNGFLYWGGFWNTPIDYQHFQVSRNMANLMAAMSADNAAQFFAHYVQWYRTCKTSYPAAYAEHKVSDYTHYLENKLNSESLHKTFKLSPASVITAMQKALPLQTATMCIKK
ncbi:M15 family metallopeptidase [Moritella marina ATCC 15381]|uniref:M15 family metallopeptidase n=1 Tax=Moritella marina ATCC 15381 TaxID=1202962 RepID=A0A5J6WG22_MORMI|nr:M15 family metallopeptidase [Moritella marina]QFI36886.1 M15 family metallopeptidase [Moritella marina ATCC 15381]